MCGSPAVFPPYRQVPGRSVLSRVCLREDRYILRWPSVVLSWLRIGRYVADTIRQLPLAAGPSLSRIFCKQNNHAAPWSWLHAAVC
jgi:hypothetical protein